MALKSVICEFLSLDGVAEDPNEFVTDWCDQMDKYGERADLDAASRDLERRKTPDRWRLRA